MALQLPLAHHYFFIPLGEMSKTLKEGEVITPQEDTVFIGDFKMMNEIAKGMDKDQLLGYMGLENDRCMLLVEFGKQECEERIEVAKQAIEQGRSLYIKKDETTRE